MRKKKRGVNPFFRLLAGFSESPAVLSFTNWDANILFRRLVGCSLCISILHCFSIKILISAPFSEATTRGVGISQTCRCRDCAAECCGTRKKNRKGCGALHRRQLFQRYPHDFRVKGACLLGS